MSGVLSFTLLLDEIGSSLFLSRSPDMRNNDHGPTNSMGNSSSFEVKGPYPRLELI